VRNWRARRAFLRSRSSALTACTASTKTATEDLFELLPSAQSGADEGLRGALTSSLVAGVAPTPWPLRQPARTLLEYLTARGDLGRGLGHHEKLPPQRQPRTEVELRDVEPSANWWCLVRYVSRVLWRL